MAGGILALDLATTSGLAHWEPGMVAPWLDNFTLPTTGNDVGTYGIRAEDWITDLLVKFKPRWVLFEAPYIGDTTSQASARKLQGLAVIVECAVKKCANHYVRQGGQRVEVFEVNNMAAKIHFVGRSYIRGERKTQKDRAALQAAFKRLMVEACIERGWTPDDDNEADAGAILNYGADMLKVEVPWDCRPWKDRQNPNNLVEEYNR